METVISCKKVRDWTKEGQAPVPIYLIGFSDGQAGESVGKEIPVGTPMSECVITPNSNPEYASRVKWNKPNAGGGFKGGNRGGNESFALSYAKDIAIAYIDKGQTIAPEKITGWAETFYQWMETKKK